MMFPVTKDDCFSRVSTFELHRGYTFIRIEIHHHLAGMDVGQYELRVFCEEGKPVKKDEYWDYGDNEKVLLHKFLTKIQHLMPSQILLP